MRIGVGSPAAPTNSQDCDDPTPSKRSVASSAAAAAATTEGVQIAKLIAE